MVARLSIISFLPILFLLGGCHTSTVDTVTQDKPFSVQIAQERSIYQAQKIQERLKGMDVPAYIVESQDSVEQTWYKVMSGAFADSAACVAHARYLDSTLHLPSLKPVNARSIADSIAVIMPGESLRMLTQESQRIKANEPDVPKDILDAVRLFPENNSFYLQRINIASFASPMGLKKAGDLTTDMPRGISIEELAETSLNLVEVQYQDNLYEDNVTLSIAKLKDAPLANPDLIFEQYNQAKPEKYPESYAVALAYGERILNSGTYKNEHIKPIEWKAYKPLVGYKVGLTTKRGTYRSYFIVVDSDCKYLFIAQSVQKTEADMEALLAQAGRGHGLEQYDEFYNTFYLLPDKLEDEDIFLGYTINKLGMQYTAIRGCSNWSRAMVGLWSVGCFFFNRSKGPWNANIFDLLTQESQDRIYGTLYTNAVGDEKNTRKVYGVPAHFVNSGTGEELNFGFGRYVCTINADGFKEEDFVKRAQRLQLVCGGLD